MFIVQLYCTYYLHYLVLHCSSDLQAAYLDYSAALTQTLRTLAALTELVAATDSRRPPPLNIQWWLSQSTRTPSNIYLASPLCPHRVHQTNQSCQACPSKPFSNRHSKLYDPVRYFSKPYSPAFLISIFNGGAPYPTHPPLSARFLCPRPH